jgi:hypothetical protein
MVVIKRILATAVLATATIAAVIPTQQGANTGSSHIKERREDEVGGILAGFIEVVSGQW